MKRTLLVAAAATSFALSTPAMASADTEPQPPPKCFVADAAGDLPTCTYMNGTWSVSYDDGPSGGIPSGFVALMVVAGLAGVGVTAWRISLARGMAQRAGSDPNEATAVTLLSPDGLDAAYLAANLRTPQQRPVPAASTSSTAEDRLRELTRLRDGGLITSDEFDTRRQEIINSI